MLKHFLLLFLCVAVVTGCKKDNAPGRGVDLLFRQTFEIPAGIGVFDVHHFYLKNIPTNYTSTLGLSNITAADIVRVITTQGSMNGTFGDANLDFIDRLSIRVYTDDPNDYLEIAYRDPAPIDPGNNMGLIPSLSDSKDFISAEKVNFDIVFWLRRTTTETTPVQLDLTMRAEY